MPKKTTSRFIEQSKVIHGDRYDYTKVTYDGSQQKITLVCNSCGNEWKCLPSNHLAGKGCKVCQYKNLPQNQVRDIDFVEAARAIHGEKYEYLSTYAGKNHKISFKCRECGSINHQRASSHLDGNGCKGCQYLDLPQNQGRSAEEFEERCRRLHEEKYVYFGDYISGRKKIKILCKRHNDVFYQVADAHLLKGQGCPRCRISRGESRIEKYLLSCSIEFEREKKFDSCRHTYPMRFDFYLPQHNLCVEYDGEQHFYAIKAFGGKARLLETQRRDVLKTEYCELNGIRLVRIPFFDYDRIDAILDETLRGKNEAKENRERSPDGS